MIADHERAHAIARGFFGTANPLKRIGWGMSSNVYLSPDMRSVVKVFGTGFRTELEAYRRLRLAKITKLRGLTIPSVRGHQEDGPLIHMDFVIAPFLLDFAGVRFDPPDFTPETLQEWHNKIVWFYGPNATVAHDVYYALSKLGIYYTDFRPSNMNLDGLPGLLKYDDDDIDDRLF